MAELEQELLSALEAVELGGAEKPCGCKEGAQSDLASIFEAGSLSASGDLTAQLDTALSLLQTESAGDFAQLESLSIEDELQFAEVEQGPELSLSEILTTAERYPGLKITFSY